MSSPRPRPPACVALVARTHGLVGVTALASLLVLHLATLPDDGPTGGFFDDKGVIPW